MRGVAVKLTCLSLLAVVLTLRIQAQDRASTKDPRVGLRAGLQNAAEAAF